MDASDTMTSADNMTSSKPYLIRAIYEWILDNQMTPHLVVDANFPDARVPMEFVDDGRIVLNISPSAVRNLVIGNDWIEFSARFGGVPRQVTTPSEAVMGIFSRENGQGMVFPDPHYPDGHQVRQEPKLGLAAQSTDDDGGPAPRSPGGQAAGKPKGKGGPSLKVVK